MTERRETRGRRQADRDRDEEIARSHRVTRFAVGLLVATIIGVAVIFPLELDQSGDIRGIVQRIDRDSEQRALDARLNQYVVCETFQTDTIRRIRHEFVDLKRDIMLPVFEGVDNTLPPGTAAGAILDSAVTRLHNRIRTIHDRLPDPNCYERYPPLEGQSFPSPESLRPNSRPLER